MARIILWCLALYSGSCLVAHAAGVQGEWLTMRGGRDRRVHKGEYSVIIDEKAQTITVPEQWLPDFVPANLAEWEERKNALKAVPYVFYDDDPMRIGSVPEGAPPIRLGRMHEDVLVLRMRYRENAYEKYTPIILVRKGVDFAIPKAEPRGKWFFPKPPIGYNPAEHVVLDLDKATESGYSVGEVPSRLLGTTWHKKLKAESPYVLAFGKKDISFRFFWLREGLLLLDITSKFPSPGTLLLRPYVQKEQGS